MKKVRIRIFAESGKILTALVPCRTKNGSGMGGLHTPHLALPMSHLHYTTKNQTQNIPPQEKRSTQKNQGCYTAV